MIKILNDIVPSLCPDVLTDSRIFPWNAMSYITIDDEDYDKWTTTEVLPIISIYAAIHVNTIETN
jgi:hypothetical protein